MHLLYYRHIYYIAQWNGDADQSELEQVRQAHNLKPGPAAMNMLRGSSSVHSGYDPNASYWGAIQGLQLA